MIIKKIEERMNLSVGAYSKELSTIRTGRANPKMLDGVRVDNSFEYEPRDKFILSSIFFIIILSSC